MAMVSFLVECLNNFPVAMRSSAAAIEGPPYEGRRTAVIEGPAGEWLELIENL